MTHHALRPCTECARHVRTSEQTCPFCSYSLGPSFGPVPLPEAPSARLSRAALAALGASTLALAACGGAIAGSGGSADASADAFNFAPPYGIAVYPDDAGLDAYSNVSAYGISIGDFDTGTSESVDAASPPLDANQGAPDAQANAPNIAPPYGIPPPPNH